MIRILSTAARAHRMRGAAWRVMAFLSVILPASVRAGDMPLGAEWGAVLHTAVNGRGQVDFDALARHPDGLRRVVAGIGRASPRSAPDRFPAEASRLAYYINAYNALAMANVIDSGIPVSLTWWRKIRFFGVTTFSIGGEQMSLYHLENQVIRPLGDERVHFALNCMVVSCPRLPQEPFSGDKLNDQLDKAARAFFSESRNLSIDASRHVVRVSSILKFYTEDFLRKAPTLNAYINRYAATPVPADYTVEFIPYDWTVNRQ